MSNSFLSPFMANFIEIVEWSPLTPHISLKITPATIPKDLFDVNVQSLCFYSVQQHRIDQVLTLTSVF